MLDKFEVPPVREEDSALEQTVVVDPAELALTGADQMHPDLEKVAEAPANLESNIPGEPTVVLEDLEAEE